MSRADAYGGTRVVGPELSLRIAADRRVDQVHRFDLMLRLGRCQCSSDRHVGADTEPDEHDISVILLSHECNGCLQLLERDVERR